MLRALGEHCLHRYCSTDGRIVNGHAGHPAQRLGQGSIGGAVAGAVEQLEVDDPASGDLPACYLALKL